MYYASVWQRLCGVVEVTSDPTESIPHPTDPARWPWSVAVTPLLVVPRLEDAPPVQAIGIAPRSMSQQSHIRLRAEHYERVAESFAALLDPGSWAPGP